ncbi:MAG: type II secretion system F family protein [Phycisphaerae bacterium]|nr:type II secretion system F family protein [Phycisphaerae bacterium]
MMDNVNILADVAFWAGGVWDVVLSVLLFGAVGAGIVAVFSQPGRVELSPQRQAAIATGHEDRKTVFENPIFRPILWILLSVSHHLNLPRAKGYLRQQLIAAGSPNYYTPEEYLALSLLAGLGLGLVLEVIYVVTTGQFSVSTLLMGLVIGLALSIYQIVDKASKRLRDITKQLPYALDLVSLAMGAGATFTEALRTITRENDEEALNVEFKALLAEIELGTTRQQALQNLARRAPLTSVQSLVASVIQAEQLGTPLATVLHDQATLLRMQRSARAENKAAVASVRVLVPCLLLVAAVIFTVFGPAIIRIVRGGMF